MLDPEFQVRFSQVKVNSTIQECAQLLSSRFQRLIIVDDDNNIVNIMTQTALNNFICEELSSNKSLWDKAEAMLNLPLSSVLVSRSNPDGGAQGMKVPLIDPSNKAIYKIKSSDLALTAFNLMWSKQISGVAVVDDDGSMVGNLSLRDIRALVSIHDQFNNLSLTALDYLALIKKEREDNSSKMYHKRQQWQQLHAQAQAEAAPEVVVADGIVTVATKTIPLPSNSLLDNSTALLAAHQSLSPTITFTSEDTIGHALFTFNTNRIRRLYMTAGSAVPTTDGVRLVSKPVSIVTLTNMCEILAGNCSTLSF